MKTRQTLFAAVMLLAVDTAFALTASETLPAAELTHRWSFNGDYSDSAGGADAVKCGTYVSLYGGRVHMGIWHEPNGGMTTLDIPKSELPPGKTLTIAARPLSSLGTFGEPITAHVMAALQKGHVSQGVNGRSLKRAGRI